MFAPFSPFFVCLRNEPNPRRFFARRDDEEEEVAQQLKPRGKKPIKSRLAGFSFWL